MEANGASSDTVKQDICRPGSDEAFTGEPPIARPQHI